MESGTAYKPALRIAAASAALLAMTAACTRLEMFTRPIQTPIPTRVYGDVAVADHVYILLPGVHDSMDSFRNRGFLRIAREALRKRERAAFVVVDAHLGYYRTQSIHRRIMEEVVARFSGKPITLVGVSLGGFGALATARRFPGRFDRVVLLGPFVGRADVIRRVQMWTGPAPPNEFDREIVAVWRWLKSGPTQPRISLLYGRHDRFHKDYELLAEHAPSVTFRSIEGGHDWTTWNALWKQWLKENGGMTTAAR